MAKEKSKYQGVRELTKHDENPYLAAIHPSMKSRTEILFDGNQAVIQRDTGEVTEDRLAIARIKWVESEQFVKVYTANISVFFELSKPAQRVCEYAIAVLSGTVGSDQVYLHPEDYISFCKKQKTKTGANKNSFNNGMRELAAKALIAKSSRPNLWYINPAVIFNGDRARFITEMRKRKKSKAEQLEREAQREHL